VAKPLSLPYKEDERAMLKVKHARTADCVVAGFRWHKDGDGVGSLLLGLYDDEGTLHHVGVASSFSVVRRKELVGEIAPYRDHALDGHPWAAWAEAEAQAAATGTRMPGGQSRWNAGRNMQWEALRPELVAEVAFDHLQGDRFRHATSFVRWRPERDARSCTYGQLEVVVPEELESVFRA
jgi:ATP-dependent DNA ligase